MSEHGPDDGRRMTDEEGLEVLKGHDGIPITDALKIADTASRDVSEREVGKGQGFADTTTRELLPEWVGPPGCVDAVIRATVSRSMNFSEREGLDDYDFLVGAFVRALMTGLVLATGRVPSPSPGQYEKARRFEDENAEHPIFRALAVVSAKAEEHGVNISEGGPGVMIDVDGVGEMIPEAFGDPKEYLKVIESLTTTAGYSAANGEVSTPTALAGLFAQALEVGYEIAKQEEAAA